MMSSKRLPGDAEEGLGVGGRGVGGESSLGSALDEAGKVGGPEAASFEDAIRRIGQIVDQLEGGELPLEASLALFEEGVRLARLSQQRLDRAERRIEELLGVDRDGQVVTRPFEVKLDGG